MSVFTRANPKLSRLIEISEKLVDFSSAIALLAWDQETYLPPQAAVARSRQLETLSGIYHDQATSKQIEKLLFELEEEITKQPESFNDTDKALVREMKRDYRLAAKLPKRLVEEISKQNSLGLESWKHARTQNNFSLFAKNLETIVSLQQELADCIGFSDSPYDALLDQYEQGLTKKKVQHVFDSLKVELETLIPMLTTKTASFDTGTLHQRFESQKLWDFSMHVLEQIGFDLQRGRQDKSAHPFTMGLHASDVRLTTRIIEENPISTLLSTIHEAGHGMYEQGVSPEVTGTTLGLLNSLALHESQSRFWENMIGKSTEFWEYFYPQLQSVFPHQLHNTDLSQFMNEMNVVKPSLIRVDADEVTYHMHIIIRTEIEIALIEKQLRAQDVPAVWNEKYKQYLGIDVPDDTVGCLQDIHWSQGMIGYFPTYTLGSLFSAQLYDTLIAKEPLIMEEQVAKGKFEAPLKWLNKNIHSHGRTFTLDEIANTVTGKSLSAESYIAYIHRKFSL